MTELINQIQKLLLLKPNAVIAIDGCCASGKTTFAAALSEQLGAQVIHMDDFFLPSEMRTGQRLSQPGGNIHYERFVNEVICGLKSGSDFEYRVFSCQTDNFNGTKRIYPSKSAVIVEGAYALHPEIPDIYDLKIFFEIDLETQLKRISERNGNAALEIFKNKWIPLENRYFSTYGIKDRCDIII